MNLSLSSIKEWFPFVFIIAGVALALFSLLLKPVSQRRKKAMQLLASFRSSQHEQDIEHWKEIYHGTREAASAPAGHFINKLGKPVSLVSMWAGDSEDHTALPRMAESLERVCSEVLTHTVDIEMIWSDIGQLIETMHDWLEDIPGVQKGSTFLEEQYPFLKQVVEKYGNRFKKLPYRIYAKR